MTLTHQSQPMPLCRNSCESPSLPSVLQERSHATRWSSQMEFRCCESSRSAPAATTPRTSAWLRTASAMPSPPRPPSPSTNVSIDAFLGALLKTVLFKMWNWRFSLIYVSRIIFHRASRSLPGQTHRSDRKWFVILHLRSNWLGGYVWVRVGGTSGDALWAQHTYTHNRPAGVN